VYLKKNAGKYNRRKRSYDHKVSNNKIGLLSLTILFSSIRPKKISRHTDGKLETRNVPEGGTKQQKNKNNSHITGKYNVLPRV
jgi:hypothetical protein